MPVLNGQRFDQELSKEGVYSISERLRSELAADPNGKAIVEFDLAEVNQLERLYSDDLDLDGCLAGLESDLSRAFSDSSHEVAANYQSNDSRFAIVCIVSLSALSTSK